MLHIHVFLVKLLPFSPHLSFWPTDVFSQTEKKILSSFHAFHTPQGTSVLIPITLPFTLSSLSLRIKSLKSLQTHQVNHVPLIYWPLFLCLDYLDIIITSITSIFNIYLEQGKCPKCPGQVFQTGPSYSTFKKTIIRQRSIQKLLACIQP